MGQHKSTFVLNVCMNEFKEEDVIKEKPGRHCEQWSLKLRNICVKRFLVIALICFVLANE